MAYAPLRAGVPRGDPTHTPRAGGRDTQETGQADTRACAQPRSPIARECSTSVRHLITMQRLSIAALSERELPLSLIPPDTPCDARSHEECPPFAIITELRRAHGAVTTLLTPSLIRTLHTITQGGGAPALLAGRALEPRTLHLSVTRHASDHYT